MIKVLSTSEGGEEPGGGGKPPTLRTMPLAVELKKTTFTSSISGFPLKTTSLA